MTDTRNDTASVVERVHAVAANGPVIAAHFLGRMAVFVLGEEAMVLAPPRGEFKSVAVHGGAILATAVGESVVVSGGDDGKVVETDVSGTSRTVADRPQTSLDRSCGDRARRRGGLVGRQDRLRTSEGTAQF